MLDVKKIIFIAKIAKMAYIESCECGHLCTCSKESWLWSHPFQYILCEFTFKIRTFLCQLDQKVFILCTRNGKLSAVIIYDVYIM